MKHNAQPRYTVRELAGIVQGTVIGLGDAVIQGIDRIETASANDITFLSGEKYAKFLPLTKAACVITTPELLAAHQQTPTTLSPSSYILVADSYRAFIQVMQQFFPPMEMERGLRHSSAVIDPSANVHGSASIGPGCVISAGCTIDEDAQLFANVVLYSGVKIGAATKIHANVSCAPGTLIGKCCIIHSGVVIGSDGFGFLENPDGSFEKIPQVGIVMIGDDVEIGANTCIDRAAVGATRIGSGVKLDNLIHIAHGVTIGDNTAMAAQAGISGSTTLGKRNRIAGQVGIVGHIQLADDVIVEAQSGVSKSVTVAGHYFGSPAKEHRTALRMEAALRRLPELLSEFRDLQRIVAEMSEHES